MEVRFVVLTKPRPKVTLTQKSKWGKRGQEWKRLQDEFLQAFHSLVTKEQREEIKKWEFAQLRFVFAFKKIRVTKYTCECGKVWETKSKKIVCPACKKEQAERWSLGQHGDTTNLQKQYEDFIQATGLFNDRIVLLTQSEICMATDNEGIVVILSPHKLRGFSIAIMPEKSVGGGSLRDNH